MEKVLELSNFCLHIESLGLSRYVEIMYHLAFLAMVQGDQGQQ